ncbi:Golgi mannosyltransferase complex subunit [Exophiala sideris]|uniref:Golgi mannosyltransferase complex subunit n=1 Tax=Exophiala sideris TaxID=1016849 RepID=A0ABR0JBR5_9EURO|nr:Golgi mannosyltransferase complex subunit [Exophiala sideris]KAK5038643.1 Golgi mannosyltransferase complex subunit [Exophiala sideris]KAK5060524.1 Golgi mannosyltransferase complex subunit [Exophiala sideris]KAK5183436.1 Golgi mannosyltransferase complex subunit [Eurotiomycetes sp. CCFEE 6388]
MAGYFDMRQSRTSNRTIALGLLLVVVFIYFLYSISNTSITSSDLRQRLSDAAADNPLSPPTSAFRKQADSLNSHGGVHRPPPVVHYQLNNLTASSNPAQKNEKVLILTPLARFYPEYWANLLALSYPHEHISLGFITPKTKEGNEATTALQEAIKVTQSGPEEDRFQSITILRQDIESPLLSQEEKERHKMENQRIRRAAMSRARNSLLFTTIGPSTSWVLWLDSDIVETPPTLIQDLASHDKSIIVPNCYQRYLKDDGTPDVRPYDYNSWRDSDTAQQLASQMGPDDILLEGYAEMPTYRTLMAMLANTGPNGDPRRLMPLDGVGGTALLVKAEVHRDGAMFPAFPFYHLIETEGFAKMARRLGFESWGLPDYLVSDVELG